VISREDFVFTIGYEGDQAVVDGKAKARYAKLGTMELARAGLFRAAFASALYEGDQAKLDEFAAYYNGIAGSSYRSAEEFSRLFGIKKEEVRKALVL